MLKFVGRFFTSRSSWTRMRPCLLRVMKQFSTQRFYWRRDQRVVYNWTSFHFRRPRQLSLSNVITKWEETYAVLRSAIYQTLMYLIIKEQSSDFNIASHYNYKKTFIIIIWVYFPCYDMWRLTFLHKNHWVLICEKSIKLHHYCSSGPIQDFLQTP